MRKKDLVEAALKAGETITPVDAMNRFRTMRLAAIVFDLRREGMKIRTEVVQSDGVQYARYSLEA